MRQSQIFHTEIDPLKFKMISEKYEFQGTVGDQVRTIT
jgi:hypothetical protein